MGAPRDFFDFREIEDLEKLGNLGNLEKSRISRNRSGALLDLFCCFAINLISLS